MSSEPDPRLPADGVAAQPAAPTAAVDDGAPAGAAWHPLAPAAARLSAVSGGLVGGACGLPVAITAGVLRDAGIAGVFAGLLLVAATAAIGALYARARARRTRWRLDARGLQVRRGLLWHGEMLVPRNRVQHLDLERGPLERRAGLATLVVHTAGTRLHALRQSGFAEADAVALRDALVPPRERDDDVL